VVQNHQWRGIRPRFAVRDGPADQPRAIILPATFGLNAMTSIRSARLRVVVTWSETGARTLLLVLAIATTPSSFLGSWPDTEPASVSTTPIVNLVNVELQVWWSQAEAQTDTRATIG
jgi:hypothetical protein